MKKLITCLVVCVLSGVVAAEIHHVPADFPTIQYAIGAALDGDEIIVAPGTYTSTADEVVDMRGKEIWLHSSNGGRSYTHSYFKDRHSRSINTLSIQRPRPSIDILIPASFNVFVNSKLVN